MNQKIFKKKALEYSKKKKINIEIKKPLKNQEDFALAYTPGIAEVSKIIAEDPSQINNYTFRRNALAVISDGSAVLGLGNIGAKAAYPVMEGKSMIFKELVDIDAIPIVLDTQDTKEIIEIIKNLSSSFSAINLEDISAPRCFEIEEKLEKELSIPFMHDDQHGTAVVVLAALLNAIKLTGKDLSSKIIINGAGAAGYAIANLLFRYGFNNILMLDSKGLIYQNRSDLNKYKKRLAEFTNSENIKGNLQKAIRGADIFIGVSRPNLLKAEDVKTMKKPIVFALSNPVPEIMPKEAYKGGAEIVGTGRSDFNNQINNALIFPGIFRGVIDLRLNRITKEIKMITAQAIVEYHQKELNSKNLLPNILDKKVHQFIADKIKSKNNL